MRHAVTMRAPRSEPIRIIAKPLRGRRAARVVPGREFAGKLFRNEVSSVARPPQLEREAKTSVDAEPVVLHFLADDLSHARIEEFGFRGAGVPDRLAIQAGAGAQVHVDASEELRAEAVVVVLEVTEGVRATHRQEFPADRATHVGLDLRPGRNADAQRAHDRHEVGVDLVGRDYLSYVGAIRKVVLSNELFAVGRMVIPGNL